MKKLKLNLSSVQGVEFLTREQLKTISGGSNSEGGGSDEPICGMPGPGVCPEGQECRFEVWVGQSVRYWCA